MIYPAWKCNKNKLGKPNLFDFQHKTQQSYLYNLNVSPQWTRIRMTWNKFSNSPAMGTDGFWRWSIHRNNAYTTWCVYSVKILRARETDDNVESKQKKIYHNLYTITWAKAFYTCYAFAVYTSNSMAEFLYSITYIINNCRR